MEKILYIAPNVPYKESPHAGGQLAYYYVSKMEKNINYELKIISYGYEKLESESIPKAIEEFHDFTFLKIEDTCMLKKILNKFSFSTIGSIPYDIPKKISNLLYRLKNEGYTPDAVIFDWEQSSYLLPLFKKFWKTSKYIVVEQDIRYQSLYRFYKQSSSFLSKVKYFWLYNLCICKNKKSFPYFNEICVLSDKDKKLVEELNVKIESIRIVPPFYHDYSNINMKKNKENLIIFMGYMTREENIEAVKWFIYNVVPKIKNIKFVVIGGGVSENLKKLENENIVFTGYVSIEEIENYYSKALCMVVPLIHGAGVKIKVLEGMSAGLPILTNDVGIEGINGIDGETYFHCDDAESYVMILNTLLKNHEIAYDVGSNARKYVKKYFNYSESEYYYDK